MLQIHFFQQSYKMAHITICESSISTSVLDWEIGWHIDVQASGTKTKRRLLLV